MNRRRFLQTVGSTSLLSSALPGWASLIAPAQRSRFAYVGAANGIYVYSINADGRFLQQQTIAGAHPVAMAIRSGHLYVANGISEYEHLPRGTVEAYAIDAITGRLAFKNRMPLSLSGTSPRDLAIAPDGRSVVVAVHGGGAYNVLLLRDDGRLGEVAGIFKETGSGPHPSQSTAHPAAVLFDRAGRLVTVDQGADKLSIFSVSNGKLTVNQRWAVAAGSGPSSLVLHPGGNQLYVAHALTGTLSTFAYDAAGTLEHKQTLRASSGSKLAALGLHPSGETLYSTHGDGVQAWRIAASGTLEPLPGVEGLRASKLHVMPEGDTLLALTGDAIIGIKVNKTSRNLESPVELASLANPLSIAVT